MVERTCSAIANHAQPYHPLQPCPKSSRQKTAHRKHTRRNPALDAHPPQSPGLEFHRQLPIDKYIVDFYCHELLLAIEIDGGSHNDETIAEKDTGRQTRLESLGVKFIRFTEQDVRHKMPEVPAKLQGMIEHLQSQK